MSLDKLQAKIKLAEENARGNNREGCINAIEECYEIIKTLKPQPITYKTELAALASIAESLKVISEKR